ncbi:MAG: hypothetical protein IK114_14360 [Fibrobacter sp.]|nr:hypothetical protein [Fibrobacter sp.]
MKILRNNKIKLERGETRVGNFFFKIEGDHIKIQDLNGLMSFRVGRKMAVGIWLENTLKRGEEGHETLRTYAATVWSFLALVPDQEAVTGILKLTEEAMKRHPDWYGYKPSDDDKENAEAAQAVKEMKEFEEGVKEEVAAEAEKPKRKRTARHAAKGE